MRIKIRAASAFVALMLFSFSGRLWADGRDVVPKETTFNIHFSRGSRPLVTFTVNKKNRTFLVDTGDPLSRLTDRVIKEEHIETHTLSLNDPATQATNEVSVTHGGLKLAVPFVVVPQKELDGAMGGETIDGIIGANFLEVFTEFFDFPHKKLTFIFPAGASADLLKRYGFQDAARVPTFDLDSSGRRFVSAVLSQGEKQTTENMMIDTGANGTLISAKAARDVMLPLLETTPLTNLEGAIIARRSKLEKIQIGETTLAGVGISVGETQGSRSITPLLGMNVLSRYKMLLDFKQNALWLKP